MQLNWHEVTVQ